MQPKKLTYHEFWEPLENAYPEACKVLYEWLENYREQVNWKKMFSVTMWSIKHNRAMGAEDYETHNRHEIATHLYDFHDLPIAMQIGIFIEFVDNTTGGTWNFSGQFIVDWAVEIKNYISKLEQSILSNKS